MAKKVALSMVHSLEGMTYVRQSRVEEDGSYSMFFKDTKGCLYEVELNLFNV